MATTTAQPIKSIDVGSMFLMDLALNDESEFNCVAPTNVPSSFSTTATTNHGCFNRAVQETIFQQQQQQQQDFRREQLTRSNPMDAISHQDNRSTVSNSSSSNNNNNLTTAQLASSDQLDDEDQEYIISYVHNQRGNYCRLFKNIQGSYLNSGLHSNLWNQVKQQQPQPPLHLTSNTTTGRERAGRSSSSSSSLSNLSLTASSDNTADDSTSGSVISYSVINQFNAATAADDDGRTSSTARDEDSGIVRMIHLDNQQNIHNNSYEIDDYFQQQQHQHQRFYNKVKPAFDVDEETIMMETTEPTSDSARIHLNDSSYSERDNNKPTNNSHYYHNYSYRRDDESRRTMSASLPIQVPPRQSELDFKSSCEAAEASDFEEFLDQEYDRSSHYY